MSGPRVAISTFSTFFWLYYLLDTILVKKTIRRIAPDRWESYKESKNNKKK
jgi:hypothetical protein